MASFVARLAELRVARNARRAERESLRDKRYDWHDCRILSPHVDGWVPRLTRLVQRRLVDTSAVMEDPCPIWQYRLKETSDVR